MEVGVHGEDTVLVFVGETHVVYWLPVAGESLHIAIYHFFIHFVHTICFAVWVIYHLVILLFRFSKEIELRWVGGFVFFLGSLIRRAWRIRSSGCYFAQEGVEL